MSVTAPRAVHRSRLERLQSENAALLARITMLRAALEGLTTDHLALRRANARLRVELKELRAASAERRP